MILKIIKAHQETMFVIRAHPDEMRAGKQSQESVSQWVHDNSVFDLSNVVFIDSKEYISSYALIQRARFVMVYNSSIGLEASLMGAAVLCGGSARYTRYPTVFFPQTPEEYLQKANEFLVAEEIIVPAEFMHNARLFLYFQNFFTPISFSRYLQAHPTPGYIRWKSFSARALSPDISEDMRVVTRGILEGEPFLSLHGVTTLLPKDDSPLWSFFMEN
jgi:hypothetical protein